MYLLLGDGCRERAAVRECGLRRVPTGQQCGHVSHRGRADLVVWESGKGLEGAVTPNEGVRRIKQW